jgi:hypothetical protein
MRAAGSGHPPQASCRVESLKYSHKHPTQQLVAELLACPPPTHLHHALTHTHTHAHIH